MTAKALRQARDRGEVIVITGAEAAALREQIPAAVGVLKARRKVVLKELAERLKRLTIVANEVEIAAAGGSVELPVAFWRLAMAPEDGL
jgi:hypothetical protein